MQIGKPVITSEIVDKVCVSIMTQKGYFKDHKLASALCALGIHPYDGDGDVITPIQFAVFNELCKQQPHISKENLDLLKMVEQFISDVSV